MFRLATLATPTGPRAILVRNDRYWLIQEIAPELATGDERTGLMPLFADWTRNIGILSALAPTLSDGTLLSAETLLAPILYPRKVICTGGNYGNHLSELGIARADKTQMRPTFFLKPPSTAVVGPGPSVPYPPGVSELDWEIEVAVVIGRTARCVSPAEARSAIAGYTIGLDLSARDWQFNSQNTLKMDVFGGKAFDASCPLGPWIVPAQFLSDPQALRFDLRVNGEVKQASNTGDMIWSIDEQIARVSEVLTLEPGDVILTGTPSGSGYKEGLFLKPGDALSATVEQIGTLDVRITPPRVQG